MTATLITEWSADTASKLYSDTGKTTLVADGGTVAAMVASAGSYVSSDMVQSISGNRPTYRANYSSSGYPALEFDGTNDGMTAAHNAAWNSTDLTVLLVATWIGGTTADRYITGKSSSSSWSDAPVIVMSNVDSGKVTGGGTQYNDIKGLTFTNGTKYLLGLRLLTNRSQQLFRNNVIWGSNVRTGSPATNSTAWQINGGGAAGNFFCNIAFHMLQLWDGAMELDQWHSVLRTADVRWGVGAIAALSSSGGVRQVNVRGGADQ